VWSDKLWEKNSDRVLTPRSGRSGGSGSAKVCFRLWYGRQACNSNSRSVNFCNSSSRVGPSSRVEAPNKVARTGAPGSDSRVRLTVSSSGPSGAHACQAATRSTSATPDQRASMRVVSGSGTVSNRSDVTTPNWPPPAPRRAQNKSGCRSWTQSTTVASASTTRAPTRRSQVRPCLRPNRPIPPPKVRLATPTVGPHPAGRVRPWACSAAYTCCRRAPAPIVATPSSATETRSKVDRSSRIPSIDERPAKQCPPPRGARRSPAAAA